MRNISDKNVAEKTKTQIICSVTSLRKSRRLLYYVEKYYRAEQVTDDNIVRRMHIACLITKARTQTDRHTNTHK